MKETTKIALLIIGISAAATTGVMAILDNDANLDHSTVICVAYRANMNELKCKLNGDVFMFPKEKKNEQANKQTD